MAKDIGWELYRSFLGVLEQGSLSGTARALGLTQPTVGRHVAALENGLGSPLFTRSPQGLMPTDSALALKPFAEAMRSNAAALVRAAHSPGPGVHGTVRITASEVIGVEVLPAIVARLCARHADLKIELLLSNEPQDLLRREADIAVRMFRPRQGQLVARRVGNISIGLHATKAYLADRGTPRAVADLALHTLIGFDQPGAFVRAAEKSLKGYSRESFSLRTDSDLAQLALIRAGAGIGFCQVRLAARAPPSLERVLARQFSLHLDTWVTLHEDLRNSPRCRVTFDALVSELQRYAGAG